MNHLFWFIPVAYDRLSNSWSPSTLHTEHASTRRHNHIGTIGIESLPKALRGTSLCVIQPGLQIGSKDALLGWLRTSLLSVLWAMKRRTYIIVAEAELDSTCMAPQILTSFGGCTD